MRRRHFAPVLQVVTLLVLAVVLVGVAVLKFTDSKLFSVQSGSMEPAIPKGSLVVVKDVPVRDIAVGDVITYVDKANQTTITHRVNAKLQEDPSGNMFVPKGDANAESDVPIEAVNVVGKVTGSVPIAGYGIDFIKSWPGLILVIYLPALLIIFSETKRLLAYFRSMQPYLLFGEKSRLFPGQYKKHFHKHAGTAAVAVVLVGVTVLGGKVLAQLDNMAHLTGNTIQVVYVAPEPEPEPETPPQNTTTCTNTNDVGINSQTDQSATSGDATVEGNTNGGSATSGNASNSSSTNVTIEIDNSCEVPERQVPAENVPESNT